MPKSVWSGSRTRALIKNVTTGTTDNVELAQMLGVKVSQIYDKRYQLGLRKDNTPRQMPINTEKPARPLTGEDNGQLVFLFEAGYDDEVIAEKMGRTVDAIKTQRKNLRLLKQQGRKKQDEPIQARTIQTPRTEVSLLWGLVKYTKR
jgi:hypothetical protein